MGLRDTNREITAFIEQEIADRGLTGKLGFQPIETPYTRRPAFFIERRTGTPHFSAFLWQLNKLPKEEWKKEACRRIDNACEYFHLPC